MGSYSYTCSVTNLPIAEGEKVKYILLTSSPYNTSQQWLKRTYAINAMYNDYGGFLFEEDQSFELIRKVLVKDLIEVGTGDNPYHDGKISKEMELSELLSAGLITNNRVCVKFNTNYKFYAKPGVPTIKRIEKLLKKNKNKLKDIYKTPLGLPIIIKPEYFLIDKIKFGIIRVRFYSHINELFEKDTEILNLIKSLFNEYEVAITAGYATAWQSQMWIMIKPGTKNFYGAPKKTAKKLIIKDCVIREDVWNELLKIPLENYMTSMKGSDLTIESYKLDTYKFFDIVQNSYNENKNKDHLKQVLFKQAYNYDFLISCFLGRQNNPPIVDISDHFIELIQSDMSINDKRKILDLMIETIYVENVLNNVRMQLQPANSLGSQFGEWEKHAKYYKHIQNVIKNNMKKKV